MPDAGGLRAEAGNNESGNNKADNKADDNEADNNSTRKAERGGRNGEAVF
jgi:hypothetical protein